MSEQNTQVAEFNKTEQGIAELTKRYGDYPEIPINAPYKQVQALREARADVRSHRTGIEARRKELKAPLLEAGRAIDEKAKELTQRLAALEKPLDDNVKAIEAHKAAQKAEREKRVRAIAYLPESLLERQAGVEEIQAEIETLEAMSIDASEFGQQASAAEEAREHSLKRMSALVEQIQQQQKREAELEAERKRLAEEQAAVAKEREELAKAQAAEKQRQAEAEAKARAEAEEKQRIEARAAAEKAEAERRARIEAAKPDRDKLIGALNQCLECLPSMTCQEGVKLHDKVSAGLKGLIEEIATDQLPEMGQAA